MKNLACADRFSVAFIVTLGIAYYDYVIGPFISLWVAYLVPITIVGLACGRAPAVFLAGLGSIALVVVGCLVGYPYPKLFHFAFATACQVTVLLVVAVLVSEIRSLVQTLKKPLTFR